MRIPIVPFLPFLSVVYTIHTRARIVTIGLMSLVILHERLPFPSLVVCTLCQLRTGHQRFWLWQLETERKL